MPAAARVGDMHSCPASDGSKPHIGGRILPPGSTNVSIGGFSAARKTDLCTCVGPPDSINKGSATVFINGLAAARQLDTTVHGGFITVGFPKVEIGG